MDTILNEAEVRVVGSLVEKQVTTPDYYPLTLNALVHACNQISNRDPVVQYDERTVADAVDTLRAKNIVYIFYGADSRVPKYKHMLTEVYTLSPPELAAMCVLMLRGPQTVGEIRGRTGRLYEFADLREVEATLEGLAHRDEPLVVKLPRQSGRKEARYAHLLSGTPAVEEESDASADASPTSNVGIARPSSTRAGDPERVARLEAEVATLRGEIDEMRRQFEEFRKQFE
ncbi:MAG TPA: YceH family protein [Pyrinomonadaceae bacterium]|nr:YceH family protein [Pyrinomonadaceae bacterium]